MSGNKERATIQQTLNLVGYKRCSQNGILTLTNDSKSVFYQLQSTDLLNSNATELERWIDGFTIMERALEADHKIVIVTANVDTTQQQLYWQRLAQGIKNSKQDRVRLRLVNEINNKMINIERQPEIYMQKLYLIQLFAKNNNLLNKEVHDFEMAVREGGFNVKLLNKTEVTKVLAKINNMNSR